MTAHVREELSLLATFYRMLGVLTAVLVVPFVLNSFLSLYGGVGPGVAHLCDPVNGPLRILTFGAWNAAFVLGGLAFAAVMFFAGRLFDQRRAYPSCKVVALLACIAVPVGTALGLYTLAVLARPSVKQLYRVSQRA